MAKIQPGLERITALLKDATFPWKSIHVAGTNGKGSVCHYASSMLVGRSIRVGKFTSPHLVDRWDCITINGKPIDESKFRTVERHLLQVNKRLQIGASPFEILTAAAFTCFHDARVKVGVVEVGMGGTLDSTNILNNQAISVITKIARDHEGFLGTTLSEIAGHKAGILRPATPYIVNLSNEANVQSVIDDYAQSIGAGPRLLPDSFDLDTRLYASSKWNRATTNMLPFQQENLKLAVVAVMQTLDTLHEGTKPVTLAKTLLLNTSQRHPGRQEFVAATPVFNIATQRRNQILVDGAHNPDAGAALSDFVHKNQRFGQAPSAERPQAGWPVTWVLAMTEGKDARQYLATILKPGDRVVTTTFGPVDGMPWVKPMDPKELLEVAKSVQPDITGVHVPIIGALRALCTAKYMTNQIAPWAPITLTGSLYLVGDLHRELRPRAAKTWWTDPSDAAQADREAFLEIQAEERKRADAVWQLKKTSAHSKPNDSAAAEQAKLQDELEALGRKVQGLEIEEQRLMKDHSMTLSGTSGDQPLSAVERLALEDRRFAELHATPEEIAASLARAEKAKEALARQQARMVIVNKAREEKMERRAIRKKRIEDRRERRLENRQLEKVHKQQKMAALGLEGKEVPGWLHDKQRRDIHDGLVRGRLSRDLEQLSKDLPPPKDSDPPQKSSDRPQKNSDRPLKYSDRPLKYSDRPSKHTPSRTTDMNREPPFPRTRSNSNTRPRRPPGPSPEDELLALSSNRDNKNSFFGGKSKSNPNPSRTAATKPSNSKQKEDLRSVIPPMQTESRDAGRDGALSSSDELRGVSPRKGGKSRPVDSEGSWDAWSDILGQK